LTEIAELWHSGEVLLNVDTQLLEVVPRAANPLPVVGYSGQRSANIGNLKRTEFVPVLLEQHTKFDEVVSTT
jgi:hypothetical protein